MLLDTHVVAICKEHTISSIQTYSPLKAVFKTEHVTDRPKIKQPDYRVSALKTTNRKLVARSFMFTMARRNFTDYTPHGKRYTPIDQNSKRSNFLSGLVSPAIGTCQLTRLLCDFQLLS